MKKYLLLYTIALTSLFLTACSNVNSSRSINSTTTSSSNEDITRESEITYLNKTYSVSYPTTKIVTTHLNTMEDAAALNIHPLGAVTINGNIPNYLISDLGEDVQNIGSVFSPNPDLIKTLQPEIILSSTSLDKTITVQLETTATTINTSSLPENWEDNLQLIATLTGKEKRAEELIKAYHKDLATTKKNNENISDLSIIMLRIENGELHLFKDNTYFNSMLYDELKFKQPSETKEIKDQEVISIENLAKINPDILLIQFSEDENTENKHILDDLQANPVWKKMTAAKEDKIFFNMVDTGYQGETYLSKRVMLDALNKQILK